MARPMRKQTEALRLILTTTLSDRDIAQAIHLSRTTVTRYRKMAGEKQLTWNTVRDLSPRQIDAKFNKPHRGNKIKAEVDYPALHDFLTAHRMSLQVWWETIYRPEHTPFHRSYSNISAGLRRYRATMPSVMYQKHVPGQKVFVDFSGKRPHYIDQKTRQRVYVEIFVGILGASDLTYVTAIPSQKAPDFIQAHAQMFDYFGGVPDVVVPDNLQSAKTTAGPDGETHRGYDDLTRHYGIVVLAARPYKPKDKAKVERQVGINTDRILSRLSTMTFYSIEELNAQIAVFLEEANNRPMANKLPSRRERFEAIERKALRPLPPHPYEYAEVKPNLRVDGGYHLIVEHHRYSVPHELVGQRVDVRLTRGHVEVFHDGRTVAKHVRSHEVGGLTTHPSHQPDRHRAQAERTPEGLRDWAKSAGPTIHRFVERQFNQDRPYLGLRPSDRLKTLAGKYGTATVEQALATYADLSHVTVSELTRRLSIQAKEGASISARRSRNAGGSHTFT